MTQARNIAIIGAGMAGITCARTLLQAGHHVTLFEKSAGVGGRMATRRSPFGGFDHGAQYFTVRDPRFALALETAPGTCRPWSAVTVKVLDSLGRVVAAGLPAREPHYVPTPGMNALPKAWAQPLEANGHMHLQTRVTAIETDALLANGWQLRTEGAEGASQVFGGFDAVVVALPGPQAQALLETQSRAAALARAAASSQVAPCWTLMLAFPQAVQPGLTTIGPQWNAARSTHHRIAWVTRESSKPGRNVVERWTAQASPEWSLEHLEDDAARVTAKMIKGFSEVTGIRVDPGFAQVHRWRYAQTTRALGVSHLWDERLGLGVCGDWCLGHRVENAFVSGLELALAMV